MEPELKSGLAYIEQMVKVPVSYRVYFTQDIFDPANELLGDILNPTGKGSAKAIFFLDEGLVNKNPELPGQIKNYCNSTKEKISAETEIFILSGGEACKNDKMEVEKVLEHINEKGICRHSFVIAVGGGAVLDAAGYAAAIAHRGIRLIRIPTTVLSQNDSGVGVKNGINYFHKKNFLGTFSPPYAVINDISFLKTLDARDWRSGISEAVKVALIKDPDFFSFLEGAVEELNRRDQVSMQYLIRRCAELHLDHIASGDAFETGSSRPLDFGHWAAHKLEQFTYYSLRHGEAVAIGIALDSTYSFLKGHLKENDLNRILNVLSGFGFKLFVPELKNASGREFAVLRGLDEFREHLGGELTVMLLEDIGKGIEVHEIDHGLMIEAISKLEQYEQDKTNLEGTYVSS